MKSFIVLSVLIAATFAGLVPEETKTVAEIIASNFETNPDGSYTFSFEGSDGSSRQEKGTVYHAGEKDEAIVVEGTYRYLNDQNEPVEVHYTANEKGFVPEGGNIHPSITKGARTVAENVDTPTNETH